MCLDCKQFIVWLLIFATNVHFSFPDYSCIVGLLMCSHLSTSVVISFESFSEVVSFISNSLHRRRVGFTDIFLPMMQPTSIFFHSRSQIFLRMYFVHEIEHNNAFAVVLNVFAGIGTDRLILLHY